MTLSDIVDEIENAFLIFTYGQRHIEEKLQSFPFDGEGMEGLWDWHDRLWANVFEFLNQRFPKQGKPWCFTICSLQMNQIREKIERIEQEFGCYQELLLRHASE